LKLANEFYENKREIAVKGLRGDSDSLRAIDFRLDWRKKDLHKSKTNWKV
jgi:hypothetical protein